MSEPACVTKGQISDNLRQRQLRQLRHIRGGTGIALLRAGGCQGVIGAMLSVQVRPTAPLSGGINHVYDRTWTRVAFGCSSGYVLAVLAANQQTGGLR